MAIIHHGPWAGLVDLSSWARGYYSVDGGAIASSRDLAPSPTCRLAQLRQDEEELHGPWRGVCVRCDVRGVCALGRPMHFHWLRRC